MVPHLLLVALVLFVGSSSSAAAMLREEPGTDSSLSSAERRNQATSCGPQEGSFMIESTYFGPAGTFNIATTALGQKLNEPEVYHLQPFVDDLSKGVTFQGCFLRNSLFRFVIYIDQQDDSDGKLPTGDYILTVNGRQIVSETTQSLRETFTQYFFSGDSHGCVLGNMFTLTIQFDKWPFEIEWELENLTDEAVVPFTHESSQKFRLPPFLNLDFHAYTSDFDNALLFVDHCLTLGDNYQFSIFDEAGDGLLAPSYYEIASSDVVILRREGNFGSSDETVFQSDGTVLPPTRAPVVPTAPTAPFYSPVMIQPTPTSVAATEKPAAPARTPVSFPEVPPGPALVACFTASTTVFVKGKGNTKMSQLKIGDYIAVENVDGGSTYEQVYSFGHYEPNGQAAGFLELFTNQTTTSLQVSPDHLVFVYRSKAQNPTRDTDVGVAVVPAASVCVGDLLVFSDNQAATVKSIKPLRDTVGSAGLYAPFTPSGKFLANEGLLVSSFVGFDHLESVTTGGSTDGVPGYELLSHHWLAHSFEFPHRVMCHYLSKCPEEVYTKNGLSTWVAGPMELASRWMELKSGFLKATLFVAFVLVCSIFTLLELVFFQQPHSCMASATLLIVALLVLPKKAVLTTRKQVPSPTFTS